MGTGNFCVDEQILREVGVKDFSQYLAPGATEQSLMPDFFLDEFLVAQGGAERAEEIVTRAEKPAIKKASEKPLSTAPASSAAGDDPIAAVFDQIKGVLSENLVKKIN